MNNVKPKTVKTVFAVFAVASAFAFPLMAEDPGLSASESRPNIVLIMADDMGYSDLSCYGSDIPTPHLDQLAEDGLRFTQFYNSARCCPTRAALMTGLYPHQTGIGWMTAANLGTEGYTGDLNTDCRTMAECLQEAGYATYLSGKWHLTYSKHVGPKGPKDTWPLQRGFDRFYGMLQGGGSYFSPRMTLDNQPVENDDDFYLTDAITDYGCRFIDEHFAKDDSAPFFLYLAHYAPHLPLHARPEDIAKHRGKFKKGWDVLRKEKYQRMLEMGIIGPHVQLPEKERGQKDGRRITRVWDRLTADEQEAMDLRMAIYAAQIDVMDRGIGEVVERLKQHNALDNTLILFLSDNGACSLFTGQNNRDLATYGSDASKLGYGPDWAEYSNIPFRLYKMWAHEGGIASPLIVHWPKGISDKGELVTQLSHVTDLMPTLLELAGASYQPEEGKTFPDLVGQSLVPAFAGKAYKRGPIFWEHKGNRALRKEKWKLVADGINGAWELYDMEADRSEMNNLSKEHPEIVEEMTQAWDEVAKATHVYPLDGRSWGEKIKDPLRKDTGKGAPNKEPSR
jgi:arylsulfatase